MFKTSQSIFVTNKIKIKGQ